MFQYEAIAIHDKAYVRGVNITNNYFNAIHGSNSNEVIKGIHLFDEDGNVERTIGYAPNHAILLGDVRGMTITDSYFINWIKNPIYHFVETVDGKKIYKAEGVNVNMCTWKNVRFNYPIINDTPLNSVINNPPSDLTKPYAP